MNPPLSQFARPLLQRAESLLQRHGGAVVLLFALCYYGLYHNAGLTLVGEAGSNVLIATRILEGWRPIKDMFIGYNLMWFYPLAWMFQITGPHLLVSQIFFMTLSAITGLLGFFLVRRVTGSALLAALTAGLMILMPGAIFRNYMGFIGTLASFALVRGYVVPSSTALRQCLWMGFCGAALSLCFLIRIEPSLLFTVVWIALALLYPVGFRGEFFKRLRVAVTGTALALAAFAAVHAPFVIHAHQRGFGEEFLHQYSQFFHLFRWELGKEIQKASAPPAIDRTAISPIAVPVVATPTPATPADISSGSNRDGRRSRPGFNDLLVWKGAPFFTLSIYFPVLSTAVMTMGGGLLFLTGVFRAHAQARFLGLVVLTTTGAALGLFPQYFFFRPDSVHLSEFMVPLYPALACAAWAGASFF